MCFLLLAVHYMLSFPGLASWDSQWCTGPVKQHSVKSLSCYAAAAVLADGGNNSTPATTTAASQRDHSGSTCMYLAHYDPERINIINSILTISFITQSSMQQKSAWHAKQSLALPCTLHMSCHDNTDSLCGAECAERPRADSQVDQ